MALLVATAGNTAAHDQTPTAAQPALPRPQRTARRHNVGRAVGTECDATDRLDDDDHDDTARQPLTASADDRVVAARRTDRAVHAVPSTPQRLSSGRPPTTVRRADDDDDRYRDHDDDRSGSGAPADRTQTQGYLNPPLQTSNEFGFTGTRCHGDLGGVVGRHLPHHGGQLPEREPERRRDVGHGGVAPRRERELPGHGERARVGDRRR